MYPIESSVEADAHDDSRLSTSSNSEKQKCDEMSMISMTNAIVDPRAVMVHFQNATATCKSEQERIQKRNKILFYILLKLCVSLLVVELNSINPHPHPPVKKNKSKRKAYKRSTN